MPARPARLAAAIEVVAVATGCVAVALAVLALLRDSSSDAAWVAIAFGAVSIAWGVVFGRLDAGDPARSDADPHADTDVGAEDAGDGPSLAVELLTTCLVATGCYVLIRLMGCPVDTALVGVLGWPAWRLVNRGVDALVRRREARGDDSATGTSAD